MTSERERSVERSGIRRRELLIGSGGVLVGAGVAAAVGSGRSGSIPASPAPSATVTPVPAYGTTQAGIVTPAVPQSHVEVLILDRLSGVAPADLWATTGEVVAEVSAGALAGYPQTDVTVTVGLGLADVRSTYPDLTWPDDLPQFQREDLGSAHGGDLCLQICASTPEVVGAAAATLLHRLRNQAQRRWSQSGLRGPQDAKGVFRNGMGFVDGIINPRTVQTQADGVWEGSLGGPGLRDGSTFMVVRRMRVDLDAWGRLGDAEQSAVIGRDKATGAPLSGGARDSEVDLGAKFANGDYKVPSRSHARRAHPSFIGRPLMLRRSYGFTGPSTAKTTDHGVLFVSYQRDLTTFVLTQHRLDEGDDLMTLSTVTGSGAFWVPRGFTRQRRLGA